MSKEAGESLPIPTPGKTPSGAVTLVDVARVAGVSPITVSRALSQPNIVRSDTLAKITAAVRETGYVKNMLAGGLASSRSKLVALVLPQIANSIFAGTVQAVTDTLAEAGYQLMLALSGYEVWREEVLIDTILSRRPDGVILTGTLHTENTRKRLQSSNIPVVETWDMSPAPIDMLVGFSHEEIGSKVAEHLLEKGYRRFGLLAVNDPRAALRNAGLMATLARQGVSVIATDIMLAPATLQLGREGSARLIEAGHQLDVIVCSSDTLAHGALTELTSRHIAVPNQMAVMGFGDLNFAAHIIPPLSTVRVDGAAIGTAAAHALLDRIHGVTQPQPPLITNMGFQLIARGST
jgi:LacI family gluconate utilization system Gnt-I transcriptional repressor